MANGERMVVAIGLIWNAGANDIVDHINHDPNDARKAKLTTGNACRQCS